jgi:putative endonuclease
MRPDPRPNPRLGRIERGVRARLEGRRAEWIAALLLMAKGYRILGMRLRTPQGEMDLVAARGGVLAIVEVKRRRTIEEALLAVTPRQRERLLRAGSALLQRGGRAKPAVVRLDLVALAPGRWPRHIADAWSGASLE